MRAIEMNEDAFQCVLIVIDQLEQRSSEDVVYCN